jgi:hypothetical protein
MLWVAPEKLIVGPSAVLTTSIVTVSCPSVNVPLETG